MAIDTLTIAAFIGAIIAAVVMISLQGNRTRRTEARVADLQQEIQRLHTRPGLPTHASRELCCAIRRIYPHAVQGVDYRLADDGEGPYIKEWLLDEIPQPEHTHLEQALKAHRAEHELHAYKEERRSAYPSTGDQLDALYKARHGDTRDLEALDATIAKVKARYPKPEKCDESCD